jgi:hypothetical protein
MVREVNSVKPQIEFERDFKIYEQGVLRLRELEDLLDHLNTMGFWNAEKKIRAKLRDVSEIPTIEKEIQVLEKKIIKKHGKKNLYKKTLPSLKRKKPVRKKKKIVVGDVPEPTPEVTEEVKERIPVMKNILPVFKKVDKDKNYVSEIKGAMEKNKPLVVDSSALQEIEKTKKELEMEKAKIEKEKESLKKKTKKAHHVHLAADRYYSRKKALSAIERLKNYKRRQGQNAFIRDVLD